MQIGRGELWCVSEWARFVVMKEELPSGAARDSGEKAFIKRRSFSNDWVP